MFRAAPDRRANSFGSWIKLMPHSSQQRRLRPEEERLQAAISELVNSFGCGPVNAEVNRRPAPRESGRPKLWHQMRLFTLWLIVETWAIRQNRNIDRACRQLAKIGGLLQDVRDGETILTTNSTRIRRLYYEAGLALEKYEIEYREMFKFDRKDYGTLKERLSTYPELICRVEFFTGGLSKANEIVHYELVVDGVHQCNEPHHPPLHPPEMAGVSLGDMPVFDPLPGPTHTRHPYILKPYGKATKQRYVDLSRRSDE